MKQKKLILILDFIIAVILTLTMFQNATSITQSLNLNSEKLYAENSNLSFDLVASPKESRVKAGETVVIKLSLANINVGKEGLNSIVGYLGYDETLFESVEINAGGPQEKEKTKWELEINRIKNHKLYGKFCIFTMQEGVTENQDVATLTFKLKSDLKPQTTKVTFTQLASSDGEYAIPEEDREAVIIIYEDEIPEIPPTENETTTPQTGDTKIVWMLIILLATIVLNILAFGKNNKTKVISSTILILVGLLFMGIVSFATEPNKEETIKNLSIQESWLNSEDYLVTDETVSRFPVKTRVENIRDKFNKKVKILKDNNNPENPYTEIKEGNLSTGMYITIENPSEKDAEGNRKYIVSVLGDLDGDGDSNQVELTTIIRNTLNKTKWNLQKEKFISADITVDNQINRQDVLASVKYIVYGEMDVPDFEQVEKPTIEIVKGEFDKENNCYTGDILIKITENEKNANKTQFKINREGTEIVEYTEIERKQLNANGKYEKTITIKQDGIYKISAYTTGQLGNRSEIPYIIVNRETIEEEYAYRIEYYYDGIIDNEKTETKTAKVDTKITEYEQKSKVGYKFEKAEPLNSEGNVELTITKEENQNVLKVYYVRDNFKYTVHYFYEGIEDETKKEESYAKFETKITNYKDKNITGYKLDKVEPLNKANSLELTITANEDENIINVYYVKDNFKYTVHYFYEGIEDETKKEESYAKFGTKITNYKDKNITGYKLDKVEPLNKANNLELTITANEEQNRINVYYVKDEFAYTVHYFYDNIEDKNNVENLKALYGTKITTYTDKIKANYKFQKVEPANSKGQLELTITEKEEENTINVYYVRTENTLIIHHYEANTTTKIAEDEVIEMKSGTQIQITNLMSSDNKIIINGTERTEARQEINTQKYSYISAIKDEELNIEEDGTITGTFTNGMKDIIYYYEVNKFTITAQIVKETKTREIVNEAEIGTIEGVPEIVLYGENSKNNNIIVIPNDDYSVSKAYKYTGEEIEIVKEEIENGTYQQEGQCPISITRQRNRRNYSVNALENITENIHIVILLKETDYVAQIVDVPEGLKKATNANGEQIFEHKYETLEDAIEDAQYINNLRNGENLKDFTEIKILENIDGESNKILSGNDVIIDLNGCTVKNSDEKKSTITVENGGSLVILDRTDSTDGAVINEAGVGIKIKTGGELTLGEDDPVESSLPSTETPTIQGYTYGVYKEIDDQGSGKFNFYDGKIVSNTAQAIGGSSIIDGKPNLHDVTIETVEVGNVTTEIATLKVLAGYEAKIGSTLYVTLEDAFKAVEDNEAYTVDTPVEIVVIADHTVVIEEILNSDGTLSPDPCRITKNIILDINGRTLKFDNRTYDIPMFRVRDNAIFKITDSSLNIDGNIKDLDVDNLTSGVINSNIVIKNRGNVTLENVKIKSPNFDDHNLINGKDIIYNEGKSKLVIRNSILQGVMYYEDKSLWGSREGSCEVEYYNSWANGIGVKHDEHTLQKINVKVKVEDESITGGIIANEVIVDSGEVSGITANKIEINGGEIGTVNARALTDEAEKGGNFIPTICNINGGIIKFLNVYSDNTYVEEGEEAVTVNINNGEIRRVSIESGLINVNGGKIIKEERDYKEHPAIAIDAKGSENNKAKINIVGGEINCSEVAINTDINTILTIGTKNTDTNQEVSTTNPYIKGLDKGIDGNGKINFYDGIIISKKDCAIVNKTNVIDSELTDEDGNDLLLVFEEFTENDANMERAYLKANIEPVAKIQNGENEQYFTSLQKAIDSCSNSSDTNPTKIELLKTAQGGTIKDGQNIEIDLAGNNIEMTGITIEENAKLTISNSTTEIGEMRVPVNNNGTLKINNGTLIGQITNENELEVIGGTITNQLINNQNLQIKGGSLSGNITNNQNIQIDNGQIGKIINNELATIDGGNIDNVVNNKKLTINGGRICASSGYSIVNNENGNIIMNDGEISLNYYASGCIENKSNKKKEAESEASIYIYGGTIDAKNNNNKSILSTGNGDVIIEKQATKDITTIGKISVQGKLQITGGSYTTIICDGDNQSISISDAEITSGLQINKAMNSDNYATIKNSIINGSILNEGNIKYSGEITINSNRGSFTNRGECIIPDTCTFNFIGYNIINSGKLILGTQNGNIVSDNIVIQGTSNGIENSGEIEFYDGKVIGPIGKSIENVRGTGKISKTEENYEIVQNIIDEQTEESILQRERALAKIETASTPNKQAGSYYEENGYCYFYNLQKAIDACADNINTTITIVEDKAGISGTTVQENKNITINLNGHSLTLAAGELITNQGTLTITDTSAEGTGSLKTEGTGLFNNTGTLNLEKADYSKNDTTEVLNNSGTANIKNGAIVNGITNSGTLNINPGAKINTVNNQDNGLTSIESAVGNSTITLTNTSAKDNDEAGIRISGTIAETIKLTNTSGLVVVDSTDSNNIKFNTIKNEAEGTLLLQGTTCTNLQNSGKTVIKDSIIQTASDSKASDENAQEGIVLESGTIGDLTANSATVIGKQGSPVNNTDAIVEKLNSPKYGFEGIITFNSGIIKTTPNEINNEITIPETAELKVTKTGSTYKYTLVQETNTSPTIRVQNSSGTTEYKSLKSATNAIETSELTTITLLEDIYILGGKEATIKENQNIKLDLNGKTIYCLSGLSEIVNNGKLTIVDETATKNGTFKQYLRSSKDGNIIRNNKELILDNISISDIVNPTHRTSEYDPEPKVCIVYNTNDSKVTITEGNYSGGCVVYSEPKGKVIINGAHMTSMDSSTPNYYCGNIYLKGDENNKPTLEITNNAQLGTVTAKNAIVTIYNSSIKYLNLERKTEATIDGLTGNPRVDVGTNGLSIEQNPTCNIVNSNLKSLLNYGTTIVENSTIEGDKINSNIAVLNSAPVVNWGKLTLENSNVKGTYWIGIYLSNGETTIHGGTVEGAVTGIYMDITLQGVKCKGNLTLGSESLPVKSIPKITGRSYGIVKVNYKWGNTIYNEQAELNFYDGIVEGGLASITDNEGGFGPKIDSTPMFYSVKYTEEEGIKKACLELDGKYLDVVQVGDVKYTRETLQQAVNAAIAQGVELEVQKDFILNETIEVNGNLTIKLNGHTIQGNITGALFENSAILRLKGNGTIKNWSGKAINNSATGSVNKDDDITIVDGE